MRRTLAALIVLLASAITSVASTSFYAPVWAGPSSADRLAAFEPNHPEDADPLAPALRSAAISMSERYALAFEVPAGGKRSEVIPWSDELTRIAEGSDLWFAWRTFLGNDHPSGVPGFQVLSQWKNPLYGSPPVALVIGQNSQSFRLEGGYSHPDGNRLSGFDIGPVATGQWVTWLVNIVFSTDPAIGAVTVWRDGQKYPTRHLSGGTLYPQFAADGSNPNQADGVYSYWKIGYYRSESFTSDDVVLQASMRAGTSRQSVELEPN